MAGKISQLPAASTLTGSELVEVVQGGTSVQSTAQATANLYKGTRGSSIASAATVDLSTATGTNIHVTGSTGPITSFGTAAAGVERTVIFDSTPTITHNATSLILPGSANITATAGDTARLISEGSGNWRCVSYQKANGQSVAGSAVTSVNGATGAVVLGGEAIAEPVNALTISSGVVNIDCSLGDYFTLSLSANVTSITFTNLPASGKAQTIMVRIQQNASAAKTVAFPSSFKWAGGTTPVVSTTLSAYDNLAISTFDQGTRWEATLSKAHS